MFATYCYKEKKFESVSQAFTQRTRITYQKPHILLFLVNRVWLKAQIFKASDEVLASLCAKELIIKNVLENTTNLLLSRS